MTSVQTTGAAVTAATHYNHHGSGETNVDPESAGLHGGITNDRHEQTRADTDRTAHEAGMKVHRQVITENQAALTDANLPPTVGGNKSCIDAI